MKIYIAGPYTKGDVVVNVRNAILAGQALLEAGHSPYIPHLTHFWHFLIPGPWEQWIKHDKEWISVCDAFIRLEGESVGADLEVGVAHSLGIPVFTSIEEILRFYPNGK